MEEEKLTVQRERGRGGRPSGAQVRSSGLERGKAAFPTETRERRDWVEDSSIFSCGRKKTGGLKFDLIPVQVEKTLRLIGGEKERGLGREEIGEAWAWLPWGPLTRTTTPPDFLAQP